jgi:trehalose 6-phosphate phosphatase
MQTQFATPAPYGEPHWPEPCDLGATALLLDVDGTILDIAVTPESVVVPHSLCSCLSELHGKTGGALALVSGRPIGNLDQLFAPLRLPTIGAHGAEMRISADRPMQAQTGAEIGASLRRRFGAMAETDPRIIVEDKGSSLAVHYRLAPHWEQLVKKQVTAILDLTALQPLEVIYGKAVVEIKLPGFSKGAAVCELMKLPPFAHRSPVFVGDDTTDETVFAVLPTLGGRGYSVERAISGVSGTFASPDDVRCWLAHLCGRDGKHRR